MNPMHVKITKELKQNFSSKSSQTILIFELKCFLLLYFSDHNELWISETCKHFMWIKNYVKVIPKNDFKKIGNILYIRYRNLVNILFNSKSAQPLPGVRNMICIVWTWTLHMYCCFKFIYANTSLHIAQNFMIKFVEKL